MTSRVSLDGLRLALLLLGAAWRNLARSLNFRQRWVSLEVVLLQVLLLSFLMSFSDEAALSSLVLTPIDRRVRGCACCVPLLDEAAAQAP